MMFGLFKEKKKPVILDLSVEEKPAGWNDLTRLGFEPVFVNHEPRPNAISGDYVQTRWRLKANPEVTCTVRDSWEGGGGSTFLDFDAPWNPSRLNAPYYIHWPQYGLDSLPRLESVLVEGVRGESEPPDPNHLDLRRIAMPDPVRLKLLALCFTRDEDAGSADWTKYDGRGYDTDPVLRAHIDERSKSIAITDTETGKQAVLGFEKFLKLNRIEHGWKKAFA